MSLATIECHPCGGSTYAQTFFSPDVEFAPAAGRITSWRATANGKGTLKLRVIESGPEGGWTGVATSAAATNLEGQPNATSLPINAGDMIGVDFPAGSSLSVIGWEKVTIAETFEWFSPLLQDAGEFREPNLVEGEERLLVGAEEVLAPVVSSISPSVGGAAGGTVVTITGQNFEGATGVTFGSTPASSFNVDFPSQITAIAPPSAAGDVYVRVTGPGGSSETTSAARYTFNGPATTTGSSPSSTTSTAGGGGSGGSPPPATPVANPAVASFSQSSARWKRGKSLPRISSTGAPVGTTFSFTVNEPVTARLAFTRRVTGRRVGGTCVAVTGANAGKPKCKRAVSDGSLPFSAHAGSNRVRFQGRLSRARSLTPGTYGVVLTVRDSNGLRSPPQALSFTIVPG